MLPELIYDILILIFERVHYTINYDLDRDSLVNFALVRKAWTLPAQRILYRNVVIKYRDNFQSFDAATKATNWKHAFLRESVHALHVWLANGRLRMNPSELPTILARCPRLKDFRLTLGPEIATLASSPRALERLRVAMPSSTIRAFQIGMDHSKGESNVIQQIFQLLPPSTLDFIAIGTPDAEINHLPELDPSSFDVLNHFISPVSEDLPGFDLPFELSRTSLLPETFTTLSQNDEAYLPIVRFLGPELPSITLRDVSWNYADSSGPPLHDLTNAAPHLQHLSTLHYVIEDLEDGFRMKVQIHFDREGWIPFLTGWQANQGPTGAGERHIIDRPREWCGGIRKEEHRLTARQATRYSGRGECMHGYGMDRVQELIEVPEWREEVVKKHWGEDPKKWGPGSRREFKHVVIAKRKKDTSLRC